MGHCAQAIGYRRRCCCDASRLAGSIAVSERGNALAEDRNLGEFDITGDVKFTKIRLDT
jgi:hypothetical protein